MTFLYFIATYYRNTIFVSQNDFNCSINCIHYILLFSFKSINSYRGAQTTIACHYFRLSVTVNWRSNESNVSCSLFPIRNYYRVDESRRYLSRWKITRSVESNEKINGKTVPRFINIALRKSINWHTCYMCVRARISVYKVEWNEYILNI